MAENKTALGGANSRPVKRPGGHMAGPRPSIDQPGKLLNRVIQYVMKNYKFSCIAVIVCIVISVLANVQGTMFTKTLIPIFSLFCRQRIRILPVWLTPLDG